MKPHRIQRKRTKGWRLPDQPCYADVLLEIANGDSAETPATSVAGVGEAA